MKKWLEDRRKTGIADWQNDRGRLRDHVVPILGPMKLSDIRTRHVLKVVQELKAKEMAPRTIRNVYGVVKSLFRDAAMVDLINATPCILNKHQLGEVEDKNPEWRPTAVYKRGELEMLIADPRIPEDRKVLYALEGIAGCRHGEAAGLCWRHDDAELEPLGRLLIATSYGKGRTKTKRPRSVPVHPTLAAILADWRLEGWVQMMGRVPLADDLIVPMPKSRRIPLGKMRTKDDSWKRLQKDLKTLGLRQRRGHDLRRTMISLSRTDGARKDLLEICTHTPGRSTIDLYTEFPWEALCAEVGKLKVSRPAARETPIST